MNKLLAFFFLLTISLPGLPGVIQAGGIMQIRFHERLSPHQKNVKGKKGKMKEKVVIWDKRPGAKKRGNKQLRKRGVYTVKKGDTLGIIAQKVYGNTGMWRKIYSANVKYLENPQDLKTGQKLVLPKQVSPSKERSRALSPVRR